MAYLADSVPQVHVAAVLLLAEGLHSLLDVAFDRVDLVDPHCYVLAQLLALVVLASGWSMHKLRIARTAR